MRKVKILILTILLFSAGIIKLNAETITLTLDKAIELALQNNTETRVAKMEIEKAEAAVNEAFGYALPTLNLSANFMHYFEKPVIFFPDFEAMLTNVTYGVLFEENLLSYDPDKLKSMGLAEMSFVLSNSYETKLEASQILFNSAVFRGIGASKIYLDLSRQSLSATAAKTIVDVKKAFYGILLTEKMSEILKESFENGEKNLKNVESMYEQGLVSEYDLLTVSVQIENLKPKVIQLKNALRNAKNGLKILLGIKQDVEIKIDGEIEYNPTEIPKDAESIKKAMDKNYDLKTFEVKREIDEEMIAIDRSEYWPTIAAFGSYSIAGQSDNFDFMNYNTGLVGLNFSINLFNGMKTNERVQQKEIALYQTDEQIKLMKEGIKTQVQAQLLEIQRVTEQIDAQNKNIELAKKAYEISNVKYKEGTGTQLDTDYSQFMIIFPQKQSLKN